MLKVCGYSYHQSHDFQTKIRCSSYAPSENLSSEFGRIVIDVVHINMDSEEGVICRIEERDGRGQCKAVLCGLDNQGVVVLYLTV